MRQGKEKEFIWGGHDRKFEQIYAGKKIIVIIFIVIDDIFS